MSVAPITCHILDTTIGKPASGVNCQIFYLSPLLKDPGDAQAYELPREALPLAINKTDKDGRIKAWILNPELSLDERLMLGLSKEFKWEHLIPGLYKIKFFTGKYFHSTGDKNRTFFPFIEIAFQVEDPPDHHYHVPLLLSNHSYTTYRGS